MKTRSKTASWGICISVGLEGQRQQMAKPDGDQAQQKGEHGIGARAEPFPVPREIKRLQTEGGKRCVAAADAGHEEGAERRRDQPASVRVSERGEQADDEGAGDVDDERAIGKRLPELPRHKARDPESRDTAKRPADTDPEI